MRYVLQSCDGKEHHYFEVNHVDPGMPHETLVALGKSKLWQTYSRPVFFVAEEIKYAVTLCPLMHKGFVLTKIEVRNGFGGMEIHEYQIGGLFVVSR